MNPDFLGALLIGLVGAGHCMGMCGGIASLLSLGSSSSKSSPTIPLFYNLGRLSSYALIGALVGGAISGLSELSGLAQSLAWLRFVAAIFMASTKNKPSLNKVYQKTSFLPQRSD